MTALYLYNSSFPVFCFDPISHIKYTFMRYCNPEKSAEAKLPRSSSNLQRSIEYVEVMLQGNEAASLRSRLLCSQHKLCCIWKWPPPLSFMFFLFMALRNPLLLSPPPAHTHLFQHTQALHPVAAQNFAPWYLLIYTTVQKLGVSTKILFLKKWQ